MRLADLEVDVLMLTYSTPTVMNDVLCANLNKDMQILHRKLATDLQHDSRPDSPPTRL